jgi:hypothetical protein
MSRAKPIGIESILNIIENKKYADPHLLKIFKVKHKHVIRKTEYYSVSWIIVFFIEKKRCQEKINFFSSYEKKLLFTYNYSRTIVKNTHYKFLEKRYNFS